MSLAVVVGNLANGLRFIGPCTFSQAEEHLRHHRADGDEATCVPLEDAGHQHVYTVVRDRFEEYPDVTDDRREYAVCQDRMPVLDNLNGMEAIRVWQYLCEPTQENYAKSMAELIEAGSADPVVRLLQGIHIGRNL
jgi:hypothetical protein